MVEHHGLPLAADKLQGQLEEAAVAPPVHFLFAAGLTHGRPSLLYFLIVPVIFNSTCQKRLEA
jgi:hypothetical protein